MAVIRSIARRELRSYFATPLAYVFIVIFLVLTGLFTFYLGGFYERGQADLAPFFNFHPWLYLFLVPAIAMRLWAEERKSGSIELLLTLPVTLWQAVLGKFLAAWLFIAVALALTFPIWITVNYLGDPDNGVIVAGYIGSLLMAGGFLAIGSCISAATRNQVVAFILTVVICFLFMLAGFPLVLDLFSGLAARAPGRRRRQPLVPDPLHRDQQGRDRPARRALLPAGDRRLARTPRRSCSTSRRRTRMSTTRASGRIRSRPHRPAGPRGAVPRGVALDQPCSRGARSTSPRTGSTRCREGTQKIVGTIKEPVNLYLFFSDKATPDLPQLRTYAGRVREMLEEFASRSDGKLKLHVIDPLPFSEEEDRATAFGLRPVNLGNDADPIYFGIAATNSVGDDEIIPFLDPAKESFLEYDLARLVYALANPKKPVVGLLSSAAHDRRASTR